MWSAGSRETELLTGGTGWGRTAGQDNAEGFGVLDTEMLLKQRAGIKPMSTQPKRDAQAEPAAAQDQAEAIRQADDKRRALGRLARLQGSVAGQ